MRVFFLGGNDDDDSNDDVAKDASHQGSTVTDNGVATERITTRADNQTHVQ
jgi:hypothetical protein